MNSKNPEISIIIPVLNCEKHLEKCLLSVQKQSFRDFEVLVIVNTTSTDSSQQIADRFCSEDKRFITAPHTGGNAGACRNTGIDLARGNYIAFIDGDDYVLEDYLENLYRTAINNDADIAVCSFQYYYQKTGKTEKAKAVPECTFNKEEALYELLSDNLMRFYLWNKLWKRSLFFDTGIRIPSDMFYEDAVVCPRLYAEAKKTAYTPYIGYIYTRYISKYREIKMTKQRINDYIHTVPMIRLYLEEDGSYKPYRKAFRNHICHVFFSLPYLCWQARKELKRSILGNTIRSMHMVLRYDGMKSEELRKQQLDKPVVE